MSRPLICSDHKNTDSGPAKIRMQGSINWVILLRLIFVITISALSQTDLHAQSLFIGIIKNAETGEPLPGATASIGATGAAADESGVVKLESTAGKHNVVFSFLGFKPRTIAVNFASSDPEPFEVTLEPDEEELEEVIITSTRSSRTIADIPTRVEFIAGEELDEKANMKPGDIRMLLSESTGIHTQQTSATSANASIRIQGLDGRYTQLLKDGFPLYTGFSGGLGLLQTPPLDLKQVEVIKGSSSTLYGGGAIAGLVNLISKTPGPERELKFLINGTSAKGLDVSGFFGQKFNKIGVTLFAARNANAPYDPAGIDLTAIPKVERYSINPRVFVDFSDDTKLNVGLNFTDENRIGGDIHYIKGNGDATHRYFEDNNSRRYSTQLGFTHKLTTTTTLNVRNSFNHFSRVLAIPDYTFDGTQNSSFSEINIVHDRAASEWIAGINLWTDDFRENKLTTVPLRDYSQTTFGAFLQNTMTLSEKISVEAGLRGDYVIDYGLSILPRVSLLYKASEKFSSRLGGGLGYKAPTLFTEESERIQYQNVLPISPDRNKLERSYGANWDLNYRTGIGELAVNINHLFFYTYLNDPLVLTPLQNGNFAFENLAGFTDSKGSETNLRLEYGDFKLFVGYTYTDTRIHDNGTTTRNPLTPKHKLNNVLMYEVEEKWKIGLEGYYFGEQRLSDGSSGRDYWICGFMAERIWTRFSLFLNFENFLDTRQTRFDSIYTGPISNPVFRDIYAPVDGFVINGGVKLSL